MAEYLSPGVYVEEVDRGPKPIEGVSTATAVFVGFSEKAQISRMIDNELVTRDLLNKPQLVTNWSQYVERYGEFVDGAYLPQSVYGFFQNGGGRCYVVSVKTIPKAQAALLNNDGKGQLLLKAKHAGFDGSRIRVQVDVPKPAGRPRRRTSKAKESEKEEEPPPDPTDLSPFDVTVEYERPTRGGWQVREKLSGVTLVEVEEEDGSKRVEVAYENNKKPELIDIFIPEGKAPLATLWPCKQQQSLRIEPELLTAPTAKDFQGEVTARTGVEGLEALDDVSMLCVPDLMTTMPDEKLDLQKIKSVQTMIIAHCERAGDRVAILDAPPDLTPQEVVKWRQDVAGYDSSYAALYYPWIQVNDPLTNRPVSIPPSGHLAGVWARNDGERGVHKAPANEVIRGVIGLPYNVTKWEQDVLNPIGVNCVRAFPGRGIRVWGARTLSSNPSWRYLNVRRLFNFVEKSIEGGTQWVVFEPNNRKLWARVKRDISAFLKMVWRDGALFGNSPQEAFYVKCDDELNPPESRDLGRLIIEIGLAPVKPAEFVIFRISQWAGPGSE